MKYKIGNVEVEAVQWDGKNSKEIKSFVSKIGSKSKIDVKFKWNINIEYDIGYYIVATPTSIFIMSEQDFNNMATKVKEPKFKVGDEVYYICQNEGENFDCDKVTIKSAHFYSDHYTYELTNDKFHRIYESNLFTLEEAIEKLKKL